MQSDFIHVGLHKTGSTFLQRQVFPRIDDVFFYGPGAWRGQFQALDRELRFLNPFHFDTDRWAEQIRSFKSESGKSFLYSQESLVGGLFDGYRDNCYIAEQIASLFPECKILFVFRRQDTWVESVYKQTLHLGFSIKPDEFIGFRKNKFGPIYRPNYIQLSLNVLQLDWDKILDNYKRVFGKERVLALPYELMVEDRDGFLQKLYDFSEMTPFFPKDNARENRSYSSASAKIAYYVNRFVPTRPGKAAVRHALQERLDRLYYRPTKLIDPEVSARILDMYKESNRSLQSSSGVDLERYGYF